MEAQDMSALQAMKDRIDGIERLALELKDLGEGVPAIEKNVRSILSLTYALKFGVSDIVDVEHVLVGQD